MDMKMDEAQQSDLICSGIAGAWNTASTPTVVHRVMKRALHYKLDIGIKGVAEYYNFFRKFEERCLCRAM